MHIFSNNEWDPLRAVVVGTASYANWPSSDAVFRQSMLHSRWRETEFSFGAVDSYVIDQANQDLDNLTRELQKLNIEVFRPLARNYQELDQFYGYCPRDSVLVVGDQAIAAPMAFPSRRTEWQTLTHVFDSFKFCSDSDVVFDAANVCRLGRDLLYLVSGSGNLAGAHWLQDILGSNYRVHVLENIYQGVHIDSTIAPLKEGLVLLNASRVNESNMPAVLKNWDHIWLHESEIVPQPWQTYPYASNWIAMNLLVVEPGLVICDSKQTHLRNLLSKHGIASTGVDLRHSRTLGGGHHCVTLDVVRQA